MLKTSEISHSYERSQRFNFPEINCGESSSLLILGKSGVGKTTLLHILGGILRPETGSVRIDSTELYSLSGNKRDKFRGQNIGIVFQKPHFVESVTAEENLLLARKMAGRELDRKQASTLLERLQLGHRMQSRPSRMSQGEQQRLSIARAVINNPRLILADEPTSALDDENCREVVSLLEHHSSALNASLVIVTHDTRLKAYFKHHIELF